MEYTKISHEIIAKLQALVGVKNVLSEAEKMELDTPDALCCQGMLYVYEAGCSRGEAGE